MELVYELWGEVSLTEKIWQSQAYLDSFEREVLRTGTMQCLQGRDRAGRRILGNFADDNSKLSVENRVSLPLCWHTKNKAQECDAAFSQEKLPFRLTISALSFQI
jgi:hypothetical protein